jgi:hypothetical protein
MSPELTAQTGAEGKPMSEVGRLLGVFFEPGKAFADIAERPRRWLVPLLLTILSGAAYIYCFGAHVGWESYLHRVMDNNAQFQQMAPEQRQRVFDLQLRFASISGMFNSAVFIPVSYLIGGGIALGIIKGLLGVPMRFKQVFSVFCYAGLPQIILRGLSIVVMFLKKPDDFDLLNPFMSNIGALMDPDKSSKFLYSLATSADVFNIWVILLTATGIKVAGGKRLSFGGALFAVLFPWILFILLRATAAAMGFLG